MNKDDPRYAEHKAKRQRLKDDFTYYAPNSLKIKPKSGSLVPFAINQAQAEVHRQIEDQLKRIGMVRALILKGRQQGISTYVEGRFYWKVTWRKGVRAFILTHEEAATQNLFEMVERYHDNAPTPVKPVTGASNAKELKFSKLDSGYKVGTAGNKGVGRSNTLQYFHGSEVAFWPHADTHAMGVMQAIPREPGTEVILESTANGIGNYFHAQWQLAVAGDTDYIAIFLPWYWQKEYKVEVPPGFLLTEEEAELLEMYGPEGLTIEHLAWRRLKIAELAVGEPESGEWKFRQEYPFTPDEAFQTSGGESLIAAKTVMRCRKRTGLVARGAKVVGVDPARFGKDKSGIAFRQGRSCYRIDTHKNKSTMDLAGICANILRDPKTDQDTDIDMMFIDIGGLGAGVYDRLIELGFEERVTAVNFGEAATENERYVNMRAQMWVDMNDWLCMGAQIPDDDELQGDLCGPQYGYDSLQRIKLEKKEDIIKRLLRSPDKGDALALTFAYPVAPKTAIKGRYRTTANRPVDSTVGY